MLLKLLLLLLQQLGNISTSYVVTMLTSSAKTVEVFRLSTRGQCILARDTQTNPLSMSFNQK